jgi:hypothetical protein
VVGSGDSPDTKTSQPNNNTENEVKGAKDKEGAGEDEERGLKPMILIENVTTAVTATCGSRLVADRLQEITLDNAFAPSQHYGIHDVAVEHKFKKMEFEESTQHLVRSISQI